MEMDGTTAGLLLGAAALGDSDQLYDLYKELKSKYGGGPSAEAIAFVEANINRPCRIAYTDYTGEIVGLNTATGGFYPGSREPVYVKITGCETEKFKSAIGETFSYALDQVKLI